MSGFGRVAILGAGAFGTALALVAARAGREVTLVGRDAETVAAAARSRRIARLPGIDIPPQIALTADTGAIGEADMVLVVVPAQALAAALAEGCGAIGEGVPVIACAKGIERATGRFMTEILADALPANPPAILSGPSFAADIAAGLPTAVTLAADEGLAAELAAALAAPGFRPYHSDDIRGVEIGGAAKNVLAIAAGIVAGRGLGASAAAALVTRGFAELMRFGRAFGARPETLTGLSGLGDLILTSSGPKSRNFAYGMAIGAGERPDTPPEGGHLAEGAFTADILARMAGERGVEMPIAAAVAAILDGRLGVEAAMEELFSRPLRSEAE